MSPDVFGIIEGSRFFTKMIDSTSMSKVLLCEGS